MMPEPSLRPALLLAVALLGTAVAPASAVGLPYEDLMRLLQARMPDAVLVALIEAEGAPALTTAQWLELRRRGASDRVLESLVSHPGDPSAAPGEGPSAIEASVPPEDAAVEAAAVEAAAPRPAPEAAAPEDASAGFRAFFLEEPDGSEIFVLTNVDDGGNRLGGEAARPVRPNLVAGRAFDPEVERELAERAREARESAPEARPEPAAYPPAPALLPENIPAPPAAFVRTGWYGGGFFYPYPISHFYPPGSYTHLKLYHLGGSPGLSHYSLPLGPVMYGPLFPAAGSHRPHRR